MKAADMFSLKGKVALVTGASSGLGTQFAKALADNGAAVVLVARRAERLKALKGEIEGKGGKAIAIEADVTDRAAMTRAFDSAEKAFGTVTILVNNAGIAHGGRAVEMAPEEWRRVLSTNLDSAFVFTKACLPALKKSGDGRIVMFAGVTALLGLKDRAHVAASKHGIVGLTKALAQDLAEFGIRVNCISPGQIDTSRASGEHRPDRSKDIPLGRKGRPFEIAGMVRSLCGPAGAYMTGQTLHINGGLSNSGV